MGTDVYLSWEGMIEEEEKTQFTGYSIRAGKLGYLRASIGMIRENEALRLLFPEEYWEGGTLSHDFIKNKWRLKDAIKFYLSDVEISTPEVRKSTEFGNSIKSMFKKIGFEETQMVIGSLDFNRGTIWLKSVIEFYLLGLKKQTEGTNPKVRISW